MPTRTPEKAKEYWDQVEAITRQGGRTAGQIFMDTTRAIVRAACLVLVLFGLIALFIPFDERFHGDNAMGATANASERLEQTVHSAVFIGVGLALFVLFRKPSDKSE